MYQRFSSVICIFFSYCTEVIKEENPDYDHIAISSEDICQIGSKESSTADGTLSCSGDCAEITKLKIKGS